MHGDDLRGAGALPGQLGDHQHLAHGVQTGPAVLLGNIQGGEADLGHLLDDLLGNALLLVDLGGDGGQLGLRKVPGQLLDHLLIFGKLHCDSSCFSVRLWGGRRFPYRLNG